MAEEYKRAGWYPDPQGKPGERWWNGASWSESTRAASVPSVERPDPYAPVAPIATSAPARVLDLRQNRYAGLGFITGAVSLFFNVLFLLAPVAIVFSILGIRTAQRLKATGVANTGLAAALVGLACGVVAFIGSIIGLIAIASTLTVDLSN